MLIRVPKYSLLCDKCKIKLWYMGKIIETSNRIYILDVAKEAGWITKDKKHYCKDCGGKK